MENHCFNMGCRELSYKASCLTCEPAPTWVVTHVRWNRGLYISRWSRNNINVFMQPLFCEEHTHTHPRGHWCGSLVQIPTQLSSDSDSHAGNICQSFSPTKHTPALCISAGFTTSPNASTALQYLINKTNHFFTNQRSFLSSRPFGLQSPTFT